VAYMWYGRLIHDEIRVVVVCIHLFIVLACETSVSMNCQYRRRCFCYRFSLCMAEKTPV
jgi:hypothetical protein